MKLTIEAEDGDSSIRYDSVSFSTSVDSVEDWASVLQMVAGVADWVTPMLLLEAVIDEDMSEMHIGWWAKENRASLVKFRDTLTKLIRKVEKCTEQK